MTTATIVTPSQDTRSVNTGTASVSDAQSQNKEPQKTPQQLHEETLAAASKNREQKAKPEESGKEGVEQKLIFGKFKTIEDAEKAYNESVSRMNEAQKKASLFEKSEQVESAQEVVESSDDDSIIEATKKELVSKLDVREDVADALLNTMQKVIDHRFKPVKVAMEKTKVLNAIASLQEKYSDFDNYAKEINDRLARYPKEVRKHINLEDLYLASKASDPNLGNTAKAKEQGESEVVNEMQNASRISVTSGKTSTNNFETGEHIWTRQEIAQLKPHEYSRYESEIVKQMGLGLVK